MVESTPPAVKISARRRIYPRLQFLATHVLQGQPLWDLCCDHGILGAEALAANRVPYVYFVDSSPLIRLKLQRVPESETFHQRWSFSIADARDLAPQFCGTIAIAGIGGLLMTSILQTIAERSRLAQIKRLILNPFCDEDVVLEFVKNQWFSPEPKNQDTCELASRVEEFQFFERGRTRRIFCIDFNGI